MANLEGKRLFVDMDGTLAKWEDVPYFERLLEEGYFRDRPPMQNVIDAVKNVYNQHPDVEVYILSSCLKESQYAEAEKNAWLDEHLPEIDAEHRLFPAFGEDKGTAIPEGVKENDFLLDDYSQNLFLFDPPATGIKLLNGINHTRESWEKNALSYTKTPQELADDIYTIMDSKIQIRDKKPQDIEQYDLTHFNDPQIKEIQQGLKSGVDVSVYARPEFDWTQMLQIREGLQEGLDVSLYADPAFDWTQMLEIRHGMENGLDVSKCASPEFDADQMHNIIWGSDDNKLDQTNELQNATEEHTGSLEMEDPQDISIFDNKQRDDMAKEIFGKDTQNNLSTPINQTKKEPLLTKHKMKGLEL